MRHLGFPHTDLHKPADKHVIGLKTSYQEMGDSCGVRPHDGIMTRALEPICPRVET